jgi:hypothetical protein
MFRRDGRTKQSLKKFNDSSPMPNRAEGYFGTSWATKPKPPVVHWSRGKSFTGLARPQPQLQGYEAEFRNS